MTMWVRKTSTGFSITLYVANTQQDHHLGHTTALANWLCLKSCVRLTSRGTGTWK